MSPWSLIAAPMICRRGRFDLDGLTHLSFSSNLVASCLQWMRRGERKLLRAAAAEDAEMRDVVVRGVVISGRFLGSDRILLRRFFCKFICVLVVTTSGSSCFRSEILYTGDWI
jgi:hypothetical protein